MASEFHKLMEAGNPEDIEALLSQGFKPTDLNDEQYDLFYNACLLPLSHSPQQKASIENKLKLVFQYNPSVLHRSDKYGLSLAHSLARLGYDNVLQELIQKGSGNELMIPDKKYGYLPIHTAIINAKTATVALLLTLPGISVVKDFENRNIIHYAARHGNEAMMRCCCQHRGVTKNINDLVNAKDHNNQPPAQLLFDYNTTGDVEEIMDILERFGAERLSRLPSPFKTLPY